MLIDTLELPRGLKNLTSDELKAVAGEVREKIIDVTSKQGGHLSSSLGVVELTVALHTVFDSPRDKIVWDVGHQAYAHKILTGRLAGFSTMRQMGGLSGFPNRDESPHDVFTVGHASTSISQALGIAVARDRTGGDFSVVAVVGDGSLSGGLALEGLNNVSNIKANVIVVLNDNEMSISKPIGAMANYLTKVRTSPPYANVKERVERLIGRIPKIGGPLVKRIERFKDRVKHFIVDFKFGVIFEDLGFKYLGPIDGHNIPLLMSTLQFARDVKGPVLIHILTKKGRGFEPAEHAPTRFHGTTPYDKVSGEQANHTGPTFTTVFGGALARLARSDARIAAITAAMVDGTGLEKFAEENPERFFDVGIAEEHAVSFASGLALQGMRPVVAVYSTFLQRAFDQVLHDVCLNSLPVIFAVDRAGIVGEDGATHNGTFDIAYLRSVPNLTFLAPSTGQELEDMLSFALGHPGPVAIRYPRSKTKNGGSGRHGAGRIEMGKGVIEHRGGDAAAQVKVGIVAIGSMVSPSLKAAGILEKDGIGVEVMNARFIKPLDGDMISGFASRSTLLVTVEEGVLDGGFGSAVLELLDDGSFKVPLVRIGIPDEFVPHGKRDEMLARYGLSAEGIAQRIKKEIGK